MTRAPANLVAVRTLLLAYLNIDKDAVRAADLEPAEVGIVGDPNHRGGYHCGSDRLDAGRDYSVVESSRDHAGLTLDASALDVGTFSVRVDGRTHSLPSFSTWCVAQCAAGAADTRDIREIIYSPDGKVVRRWDRLGRRTTGDSSHLFHTHFSFFRDSTKAGRDQRPLFRRYLTAIGLIPQEDNMANFTDAHARVLDHLAAALPKLIEQSGYTDGRMEAAATGRDTVRKDLRGGGSPVWFVQALKALADAVSKVDDQVGAKLAEDFARIDSAVRDAAREGAASAADALVEAVMAKLPPGTLTRDDVEAAVRDAFAGGLAADAG